jgi:cytochrome c
MNQLRNALCVLSVSIGMFATPGVQADQEALARNKGCLACHQVDTKLVGPSFKDIAAKYKGDAGAADMLAEKVKNGGTGTWGQIPMPPATSANDDDIKTLVAWILSL